MGYVYRYIDIADNIIKYVGIVWSENRTLEQRVKEHETQDNWCKVRKWKIEYFETNINSRTDAEYFEAHFISLYETDKYFNDKKSGWGTSSILNNIDVEWKEYKYTDNKDYLKELLSQIQCLKSETDILKVEILKKDRIIDSLKSELFKKDKVIECNVKKIEEFYQEDYHYKLMQGLENAKSKGVKLGRPKTGVPEWFRRELVKFQNTEGVYNKCSVVRFASLNGIAVSTYYKYCSVLKKETVV